MKKGEIEARKAPHTHFTLNRCLINLTFLCHGYLRGGLALSHFPLSGSGGAVVNSNTMCNNKLKIIATLYEAADMDYQYLP